ncbi:unnamed protein product [Knipowitschia caucasica]
MRLYHGPQVPQAVGHGNRRDRTRRVFLPLPPLLPQDSDTVVDSQEDDEELTVPWKVLLPLGPQLRCSLHQELLFCHKRGLLPRKRPELQSVLQRHREQRERVERPLSDLDRHLQTCTLRRTALESEDERRRRPIEPEYVKVKGALRHISVFPQ